MRLTLRSLAPAGLLALALLVSACGVEAGDLAADSSADAGTETTSTTSESGADRTPQQQQAFDTLVRTYSDLGFDKDEATCLADQVSDLMADGGSVDPTASMDVFNQCDISTTRMAEVMGGLGDGSLEGSARETMATVFRNAGLTDAQADCLAGAYVDEFGADPSAAQDPSQIQDLLVKCDVDPADFKPGN